MGGDLQVVYAAQGEDDRDSQGSVAPCSFSRLSEVLKLPRSWSVQSNPSSGPEFHNVLKFFSGEKQGDLLGVSCLDLGLEVFQQNCPLHIPGSGCPSSCPIQPMTPGIASPGIEILQVFGKPLIEQPVIREKLAQMFAGWAQWDIGVSKNMGTPKSSILIGISIINHPFWGTPNFWKHPYQMPMILYFDVYNRDY